MSRSKKASNDFLAALQEGAIKNKKNISAAAAKREAQEKLYAQTLRPIVEALAELPVKNGKKFTCEVSFISPAWPQIEIMIVHHADDGKKPLESCHWKKICFSVSNYINPKSYYLYEKHEERTIRTGQYHEISNGFDAAPAVLGKWVSAVAPDCLTELAALLEKKNKAKPLKPQKTRSKLTPLKPLQYKKDR